jgi:hypothetical protein
MPAANETGAWPRWIDIVAGAWLFISAFVWPHALAAQTNTWVVGALIAAFAIASWFWPALRYVDTVLAIWLFISSWFFPHTAGTAWNNAVVAIIVFFASLAPGNETPRHHRALGTA